MVSGIELRAITKSGFYGATTNIHLIVPISFDFDDSATRHEIYEYWNQNRCLPSAYADANAFIKKVSDISKIQQIMLGSCLEIGNYVDLIIHKESKASGTIRKLESLIKSFNGDKKVTKKSLKTRLDESSGIHDEMASARTLTLKADATAF